jgi:RecA-family ATPase
MGTVAAVAMSRIDTGAGSPLFNAKMNAIDAYRHGAPMAEVHKAVSAVFGNDVDGLSGFMSYLAAVPPWNEQRRQATAQGHVSSSTTVTAHATSTSTVSRLVNANGQSIKTTNELPVQPAGTKPASERPHTLIDGLIQEGELVVLGAARGVGKSWWGMDVAFQLARGHGRIMGTFTVRQPTCVLYCHGELDAWAAYDRWQRLRGDEAIPTGLLESFEPWRIKVIRQRVSASSDGVTTSTEELRADLDERLRDKVVTDGIDVLILDPWAVYYGGRENANDEVELALATLRKLQLDQRLTVVVLHHFGKADEGRRDPEDLWRGASRLADWASTRITLLPFYTKEQASKLNMTRHQARQYVTVKVLRRNAAPPDDIAAKWNVQTGQWDRWRAPEGEGDLLGGPTPPDLANRVPTNGGWRSTAEAAAALDLSESTARRLLEKARSQGLLEDYKGPRGARGWRLPVTSSDHATTPPHQSPLAESLTSGFESSPPHPPYGGVPPDGGTHPGGVDVSMNGGETHKEHDGHERP